MILKYAANEELTFRFNNKDFLAGSAVQSQKRLASNRSRLVIGAFETRRAVSGGK